MIHLPFNIGGIKTMQSADTTVFTDNIYFCGCQLSCPFCFNPELQNYYGGEDMTIERITKSVIATGSPWVAYMGGEPTENSPLQLNYLTALLHRFNKKVIMFTYNQYAYKTYVADHFHIDVKPLLKIDYEDPKLPRDKISYGIVAYEYPKSIDVADKFKYIKNYDIYIKRCVDNKTTDLVQVYRETLKNAGAINLHLDEKVKLK